MSRLYSESYPVGIPQFNNSNRLWQMLSEAEHGLTIYKVSGWECPVRMLWHNLYGYECGDSFVMKRTEVIYNV